jgi:hypothetical protein
MIKSRRWFVKGALSVLAAPAIIKAGVLMPVKVAAPEDLVYLSHDLPPGVWGVVQGPRDRISEILYRGVREISLDFFKYEKQWAEAYMLDGSVQYIR